MLDQIGTGDFNSWACKTGTKEALEQLREPDESQDEVLQRLVAREVLDA